jgi:N-acetylmuramoyl-L-alanine amidase
LRELAVAFPKLPALIDPRRWGLGLRVLVAAGVVLGAVSTVATAATDERGAGVLKVRLGGDARQTRLVIELDRAAQGKLLSGPEAADKVLLALPRVEVPGDMSGAGAGLIKSWAVDSAAGAARLRLELVKPAVVKRRFLLAPGDGVSVYRYVVDVAVDETAPVVPAKTADGLRAAQGVQKVKATASDRIEASLPARPLTKIIVIDAGHGGKDVGASGADTREKDVNLAAAKALRDRLERSGRYKVVLTRDSDVFVPLDKRVQIARRANADLFISLHADAGGDATLRGASVYTLSEKGADRAVRLAEREDWVNVNLQQGQDEAVNRILLDLTQRGTVNRSAIFAETLLRRIADRTPLLKRSHRDAGLAVLLAPDVPAVLLEMGFITNKDDERALNDADQRRKLMDGVTEAIDAYFAQELRFALR